MSSCIQCKRAFEITQGDLDFIKKLSPTIAGKSFEIPSPTRCPSCRQQRRITFRNDQHYYRNTCVLCKKSLISIYSPDKKTPVLCDDCFWSDQFDPLQYGRDIDFSRSFIDQFAETKANVPRLAIYHTQSENAEYRVHSSRNRNCYMSSSVADCEEVHYSDFSFLSRDCLDLFSCEAMELCYECLFSEKCFNSDWLEFCFGTSDSIFCFDCKGCRGCLVVY